MATKELSGVGAEADGAEVDGAEADGAGADGVEVDGEEVEVGRRQTKNDEEVVKIA